MQDTNVTEILFRKEKDGGIVAIMPYEISMWNSKTTYVLSYAHIGQHSDCVLEYIPDTEPAKAHEYADLKKELEQIGYNVKVIRKVNQRKHFRELARLQKKQPK